MNPNKRPPPPSSAGAFEGGDGLRDATKRARDFPDGKILRPGQEQPGNVLLVRVTDIVHPVTILALQQIFSRFGKVDKIVMFDKGSGFQALVQMADVYTAMNAHEAADMQEMYSGCNLIRVGYSNLQNVTVKANTERSWDFNIGPPLEGALPPGTSPVPSGTSGGGYRRPASSAPVAQATPPPASTPQRHTPQQSYSPQQYSPYSAAHPQQPSPSPYAPPPQQQQPYAPPQQQQQQQQTYAAPQAQSAYAPQQPQQQQPYNGATPYGQPPPGVNGMATGGGSYVPPPYGGQQGYAPPYNQGPPAPPFTQQQQAYTPQQPFGQTYPPRAPQRRGDEGGGSGGGGANAAGVGASGSRSFSRPTPQAAASYYPSTPNVMPPQAGPYGSIPFSSERVHGGFGSMSMGGAGRPMPHSGRPGQGGVGGGLGAGGPGGGGGGGQGRSAAYGGAARGPPGGGGNGLLQPPMHTRHVPTSAHDNGAYRPQMRFRPSDKKSSGAAPGGAIKPRSRMPLLDPRHIQALTAPVEKQNAYHREPEEEVEGDKEKKGGGTNSGRTLSGFIRESSSSTGGVGIGKKEEGAGKGGERAGGMGKKANKREAAEMLGPDATDQLAAATAKVRVSDVAEEDGEGKRANKREAAEMLGPDATDQLAAATARVRVSDEVEDEVEGAEIKSGAAVTASAFSAVSSPAVAAVISGGISSGISSPGSKVDGAGEDEGEEQSKRKASPSRALEGEKGGKRAGKRSTRGGGRGATDLDVVAGKVDGEASVGGGCGNEAKGANGLLEEGSAGGAAELVEKQGVKPQETVDRDVVPKDGKELSVTAKVEGGDEGDTDGSGGASKEKGGEGSNTESEAQEDRQGVDNPKTKRGSEADAKSDGRRGDEEVGDVEDEKVAEGEAEVGDGAEGEAKVKSPVEEDEDEDDGVGETEAETVDVGAWAAAAPATRSPILMVLHVDTQEVSAGALCQLFGLYGDVIKVKLVSSRGMALVQMKYAVQAVNAQRLLDQTPLCGMLLEVKASSQWTINDPTATDFSQYQGIHRYDMAPSPEDSRYRDCLSPPCATLVVDNVSPDVSAEDLTAIFVKHGAVSSVDLDTHAEAPLDAVPTLTGTGGNTSEPKPSVQALVHMEANGRIGATEAAVHALVMTHNLTLRERRLRVSFLSGERHVGK